MSHKHDESCESDLIRIDSSQHFAIMCFYALTTQMITDGPNVGVLPVSFRLAPVKPHKCRVMLVAPYINGVIWSSHETCAALILCSLWQWFGPPTRTTIPVPTVSQGLVGKQQLKSCNYSLNVPGQNA